MYISFPAVSTQPVLFGRTIREHPEMLNPNKREQGPTDSRLSFEPIAWTYAACYSFDERCIFRYGGLSSERWATLRTQRDPRFRIEGFQYPDICRIHQVNSKKHNLKSREH